MNYKKWYPIYREICTDFSFSEKEDKKSAMILDQILQNKLPLLTPDIFLKRIQDRSVVVFGAGPSLEEGIIKHKQIIDNALLISADGATTGLIKKKIFPDIIVTDLDGDINDQLYANKKGSFILIHAHGDNISTIESVAPKFFHHLAGSTQADPKKLSHVFNFGGFTDGDRCVFLATHFHAYEIFLIGFDVLGPIGSYSLPHTKNSQVKLRKLVWAKKLITLLSANNSVHILD
jgi:2-amino-4-hydroxy-6-hydroxymethyldihydropteridine diphosphokinase